jgi:hypothetical protein
MRHFITPGQRWNSTKYKVWLFLALYAQKGNTVPLSVESLAYWTGVNVRSLQVLVIKWRSPSWRRILKRKLPDGRLGYVIGARGREWIANAPLFIPESVRDMWYDEIVEHQERIAERKRQLQARVDFYKANGYWPS